MQFRDDESRSLRVGAVAMGVLALTLSAGAQAESYKAPRNEFGQPDLQGNCSNATLTALERAPAFGTGSRRIRIASKPAMTAM